MLQDFYIAIMFIISSILIVITIGSLIRLYRTNQLYVRTQLEYNDLRRSNKMRAAQYSQSILDFIRHFISQVALLQTLIFKDTHDLSKVSKPNIDTLAKDVAHHVYDSLNKKSIAFDDALFTESFFHQYIIDTSLETVKSLITNMINKVDMSTDNEVDYN